MATSRATPIRAKPRPRKPREFRRIRLIAACLAATLCPLALAADTVEKVPALLKVPEALPDDERWGLEKQRQELDLAYGKFVIVRDEFNRKPPKERTDAAFDSLMARLRQIIETRREFNRTIALRVRTLLSETDAVPVIAEVPATLPDPIRSALVERRAALVVSRDNLHARRTYFEEHCHIYTAAEAKACTEAAITLLGETRTCVSAVKSYNWDVEQAFGEERNRLQAAIDELSQALDNDAQAMQRFGFDRRAEDFEKWARISEETKRKVKDKLWEQILETGADEMRQGIFDQLTAANDKVLDEMQLKLRVLGLGAFSSADMLRQYRNNRDQRLLPALAMQINEDIRSIVKFEESEQLGNNFEAGLEALKFFLPAGPREVISLGEVSAWALYGAGMQTVAVAEVARLNQLTDKELLALQKIHCLSERHVLARYEARVKLAMHLGQDLSGLVRPALSSACAQPDP